MPPNRGALAREGELELLGEAALNGDVLAVETNSNGIHFLLVKVTDDGLKDVPDGYVCPIAEANFDGSVYGRNEKAIRARLLRPVTTPVAWRHVVDAVRGAQQRRTVW